MEGHVQKSIIHDRHTWIVSMAISNSKHPITSMLALVVRYSQLLQTIPLPINYIYNVLVEHLIYQLMLIAINRNVLHYPNAPCLCVGWSPLG